MAKTTKKKNRKLRRQIRKTVGALFMASAIVVAAIPVQDVSAKPEDNGTVKIKVAVADSQQSKTDSTSPFKAAKSRYESKIPHACERSDEEQIVYSSGDGTYQFVYMRPTTNDTNKVAVILGYNSGPLEDSTLTIPETLEAYRKYTDNETSKGYCLVSKNDKFLHYVTQVQKKDDQGRNLYKVTNYKDPDTGEAIQVNEDQLHLMEDGKTWKYPVKDGYEKDEEGNDTSTPHYIYYDIEVITEPQYNPCYYEQRNQWKDISDKELYYSSKDETSKETVYTIAGEDSNNWKINADVAYIGAEKIKDQNGVWVLDGDITAPSEGVFAEQNNITNLIVGKNIRGISDYAFYDCGTLKSVTLENGLDTIGNGAFAGCINMTSCSIAPNANLTAIGKDAFYDCRNLTSFTVPIGVKALGDNCFEGCNKLTSIAFGDGSDVKLRELGYHLFKGCSALASIEFPSNYEESDIDIDMFEGCSSLQYIKIPNEKINIGKFHNGTDPYPNCDMDWKKFKDTVPESFYFEGPKSSEIHDTATDNSIAFKYLGQDLYEKIEYEHDAVKDIDKPENKSAKVMYQVNSKNELVKFWINTGDHPDNVTIPETIGPYGISSIGSGSFSDNCDLIKLTIPASVTAIGDGAFKGCHKLETVIFTDASTIQSIGTDAFKTQVANCKDTLSKEPKLTFVGAMMNAAGNDTVPFIYAMNGISNINNSNQEKIWITCHSGWPTNLEVQYHYDPISNTGEAQLISYPRYDMIKDRASAEKWVADLPYVTGAPKDAGGTGGENYLSYLAMVTNATEYYEGVSTTQPTENEMAIVNSALNVVIPNSVDSIKPGLFSGYVEDADGELKTDEADGSGDWDKVANFNDKSLPDMNIQSVVLNGVKEIEPYTFKNCTSLREAAIIGPSYIDDYAFDGLDDDKNFTTDTGVTQKDMQLQSVTLGTNLTDTGKRPFRGCENLTAVNCLDTDFSYNNGIIYRNTGNGTEIVECLESRGAVGGIGSYSVGPDELAGVTTVKEEAFADCDDVGKVDLSATTVDTIPAGCFMQTDDLNSVVLPDTVKSVESKAFSDSGIRLLTIPGTQSYIAQDAFMTGDWVTKPADRETNPDTEESKKQQTIIFECVKGTTADRYAKEYWYINPEYDKVYLEHTVYFWDYPNYPDTSTKELFYKTKVKDGEDAVPPTESPSHTGYPFNRWTDYTNVTRDIDVYPVYGNDAFVVTFLDSISGQVLKVEQVEKDKNATPPTEIPVHEGYTFKGWVPENGYIGVQSDMTILTDYASNSSNENRYKVVFYDYDGTVLDTQYVEEGDKARAPQSPKRSGYKFVGWAPKDFSKVTSDMTIVAVYEKSSSGSGGSGSGSGSGSSSGSDDKKNPSASPSAAPTSSPSVTKYTVSVSGGSGSGSYAAGDIVAINAYFMGAGQNFDKWTTSTAGVGFANPNASSTTFTMPAANVAITATYKTGSGTAGTGSSGGGGTSVAPTNTGSGTTVQVSKPGISNTGLAGATVSGATDNFIVKVTEEQAATDAAVAALQARYGSLDRIKYFPMDISLYDSTGRTKIADTSGISVNITLPLPDDQVQYAGNNRIAAVANGSLEDLNAKFTTVDGVPCINFTASHFSPYVIYVDTANLTAGTIDSTPKTGDPIHPKWFLAIGMACISLILFFKKDKAVVRPGRA